MSRLFKPRIFFGTVGLVCALILCLSDIILMGDGDGIDTILGFDVFYWHRLKAVMAACAICCGALWVVFSLGVVGDFLGSLFGIVFERPVEMVLSTIAVAAIVFMVVSGSSLSFLVAGLATDFNLVQINDMALAEYTKAQPDVTETAVTIDIEKRKKELEALTEKMEAETKRASNQGNANRKNEAEKFMDDVAVEWAKLEAQEKAQKAKLGGY